MQSKRDSEIEQWVLRELNLEKAVRTKELCVFCSNGIATLSGTVRNDREQRAARKAAERAPGVQSVMNNIKVRKASQQPATRPSSTATALGQSASAG